MERRALREQRLLRGWSLERAATALRDLAESRKLPKPGVDGNTFGRWERGVHHPDVFHTPLLCDLYGKSAVELDLGMEPAEAGDAPGTLSDVERREFLQLLAAAGLSVALPDTGQWERLEHVLAKGMPIDAATLTDLETQTANLHQQERQIAARHLVSRLELHLDRLTELLERSSPARLKRRLIVTAGDTASLAAWTAWDRGDRAAAGRLYELAAIAAREGDDPGLRACILAYASYGTPSPEQARELLQRARSYVDRASQPATWSWIDCREAEELAAIGRGDQALRLLERGSAIFDGAQPDQERTWTCFLDRIRIGGFAISTYARLGRTQEALKAAAEVLAELGPGKKRSIVLADTASVHLQQADLDTGLHLASQGLEEARETESSVGSDHLRRLRPHLAPWLHVPAARLLDEQLQTL